MRTMNLVKASKDNVSHQYLQLVAWTAQMLNAADKTAAELGVSPEAIVAQAALETGWGKAAIGFNIFGIKAGEGWAGKKQLVTTREFINGEYITIQDWFRDYDSFADSFDDHFSFLKVNGRYSNIFKSAPITDRTYFELLQQDGYATDPNYANALISMKDSILGLERYINNGV
jgi:flagellum-specific peptidoglycan hydrolase FlgJ